MTMTTDWDDDRLTAAFRARATTVRPAPADLPDAVLDRLGRQPRVPRSRPFAFLAAAAAIVLVVGLGGLAAITLSNRPPVTASGSPGPSGSDPVADAARELNLTPRTVSDAIALHGSLQDDAEVLVSGYLSNDPGPATNEVLPYGDCDVVVNVPGHLLNPACWPMLMELPEPIVTRTLNEVRVKVPSGPAIRTVFDVTFLPATAGVPLVGDAKPTAVAVVGHFSDRRSATCPGEAGIRACAAAFVVDRVVAVDGRAPARPEGPVHGAEVVDRTVPGVQLLSVKVVDAQGLLELEPGFRDTTDIPAALGVGSITVVTALPTSIPARGPRSARTFLVGDGLDTVIEMTAAGPVVRVSPSASPPSGPVDASVLDDLVARPISVSEAILARDGARDDTELAVVGYVSAPTGPISCPAIFPDRPVQAQCPATLTWLSEISPVAARDGVFEPPGGPAFNLLIQPETILQVRPGTTRQRVIAVGHFDDHRSGASCPSPDVVECQKNFVVDAIVDPARPRFIRAVVKVDESFAPIDTIDAAVRIAGLEPSDPRIIAAFAIPTSALGAFEPDIAGSPELDGVDTVWIIRWVVRENLARPVLRTRIVVGKQVDPSRSLRAWDVSAIGLAPVQVSSLTPGPDDAAFASAPHEVLGLVSQTVRMAVERHFPSDDSELLVRGWYVPHDPAATCPDGLDAPIRPVLPPCSQGRNWLLDEPELLWSDPSKVDIDRQPTGATLNPIIPSDVPFDLPPIWNGTTPTAIPVVVLGHYADPRVDTYAGDRYFVIDQLVWSRPTGLVAPPAAVQLASPTDPSDAARRTIEGELGTARATWVSVMRPADLAVLDPDALKRAPELAEASAVWVVRRLVEEPYDDLTRTVVRWAFLADGGSRVWASPYPGGNDIDLITTVDVDPAGLGAKVVAVADYERQITSVRNLGSDDRLAWRQVGPEEGWRIEIARGASAQELAVRWSSDRCQTEWRLDVRSGGSFGPGPWLDPHSAFVEGCHVDTIQRAVMLTFDHPIDLDTVRVNDNVSGG